MMTEAIFWYWFCSYVDMGYKAKRRLIDFFGSPKVVFEAKYNHLEAISKCKEKTLLQFCNSRDEELIKKKYDDYQKQDLEKFVWETHPEFPKRLKYIDDAPVGIFYKGSLPNPNKHAVAIVGARYCSGHGKAIAFSYGKQLAMHGIDIISGMALGIDGAAHKGAIEADGTTYAILGCGTDICYPKQNIEIYRHIPTKGGIISEYPMGTNPEAWQFPSRNRIIAGLAEKVFLVEARKRSGSLITVDMALEQGKDVYALPGRPEDTLSEGCLDMIKCGAKLITSVEEILEDYPDCEFKNKKSEIFLDKSEELVYSSLCLIPKYIEDIGKDLKMDLKTLISVLYRLESRGLIRQIYKNQYVINV